MPPVPQAENYPSVLSLVFGVLSITVAVLIIFLPETRGRALPETIEDIEAWYASNKLPKKAKQNRPIVRGLEGDGEKVSNGIPKV